MAKSAVIWGNPSPGRGNIIVNTATICSLQPSVSLSRLKCHVLTPQPRHGPRKPTVSGSECFLFPKTFGWLYNQKAPYWICFRCLSAHNPWVVLWSTTPGQSWLDFQGCNGSKDNQIQAHRGLEAGPIKCRKNHQATAKYGKNILLGIVVKAQKMLWGRVRAGGSFG